MLLVHKREGTEKSLERSSTSVNKKSASRGYSSVEPGMLQRVVYSLCLLDTV
jgi:hypothetical protein